MPMMPLDFVTSVALKLRAERWFIIVATLQAAVDAACYIIEYTPSPATCNWVRV
jgi:hypothetical protein